MPAGRPPASRTVLDKETTHCDERTQTLTEELTHQAHGASAAGRGSADRRGAALTGDREPARGRSGCWPLGKAASTRRTRSAVPEGATPPARVERGRVTTLTESGTRNHSRGF